MPLLRERFDPAMREEILDRDRVCFMVRLDPNHQCRTRFGTKHRPDSRRLLTMEHVKQKRGFLPRKHRVWLIVALCGFENNRPPSQQTREAMRAYLRALYPEEWA